MGTGLGRKAERVRRLNAPAFLGVLSPDDEADSAKRREWVSVKTSDLSDLCDPRVLSLPLLGVRSDPRRRRARRGGSGVLEGEGVADERELPDALREPFLVIGGRSGDEVRCCRW